MKTNKILAMAVVLGATVLSGMPVQALVWSFQSETNPPCTATAGTCIDGTPDTDRTYRSQDDLAKTVAVQSWENYSTSGVSMTAAKKTTITPASSSGFLTKGYLEGYGTSGLGAQRTSTTPSSPYHAIDNFNNYEAVLLDFGADSVVLDSLTIGWKDVDADAMVFAYKGTGTPSLSATNWTGTSGLLAKGWVLVAELPDLTLNASRSFNNGTSKVDSSYWLVGAYNSLLNNSNTALCSDNGGKTCDYTKDYFKLAAVTTSAPSPITGTPVPGVAALFGLGLALMGWQRRRLAA